MLKVLQLNSLEELESIFKKLVNVNVEVTVKEIIEYSKSLVSNNTKLKNHPEQVNLENIIQIYIKSLLK